MTIEVDYFSDGRLKVIRKLRKTDTNVRVNGDEISIVSKKDVARLEDKTIEAIDRQNILDKYPELKTVVDSLTRLYSKGYFRYFPELKRKMDGIIQEYFRYRM